MSNNLYLLSREDFTHYYDLFCRCQGWPNMQPRVYSVPCPQGVCVDLFKLYDAVVRRGGLEGPDAAAACHEVAGAVTSYKASAAQVGELFVMYLAPFIPYLDRMVQQYQEDTGQLAEEACAAEKAVEAQNRLADQQAPGGGRAPSLGASPQHQQQQQQQQQAAGEQSEQQQQQWSAAGYPPGSVGTTGVPHPLQLALQEQQQQQEQSGAAGSKRRTDQASGSASQQHHKKATQQGFIQGPLVGLVGPTGVVQPPSGALAWQQNHQQQQQQQQRQLQPFGMAGQRPLLPGLAGGMGFQVPQATVGLEPLQLQGNYPLGPAPAPAAPAAADGAVEAARQGTLVVPGVAAAVAPSAATAVAAGAAVGRASSQARERGKQRNQQQQQRPLRSRIRRTTGAAAAAAAAAAGPAEPTSSNTMHSEGGGGSSDSWSPEHRAAAAAISATAAGSSPGASPTPATTSTPTASGGEGGVRERGRARRQKRPNGATAASREGRESGRLRGRRARHMARLRDLQLQPGEGVGGTGALPGVRVRPGAGPQAAAAAGRGQGPARSSTGLRLHHMLSWLRGASLTLAGPQAQQDNVTRWHRMCADEYRQELQRLSSAIKNQLPLELYPLFGVKQRALGFKDKPSPYRTSRPTRTRRQAQQYDPSRSSTESDEEEDGLSWGGGLRVRVGPAYQSDMAPLRQRPTQPITPELKWISHPLWDDPAGSTTAAEQQQQQGRAGLAQQGPGRTAPAAAAAGGGEGEGSQVQLHKQQQQQPTAPGPSELVELARVLKGFRTPSRRRETLQQLVLEHDGRLGRELVGRLGLGRLGFKLRQEWDPSDEARFAECMLDYYKNFKRMKKKYLPHKSIHDLNSYYYNVWKTRSAPLAEAYYATEGWLNYQAFAALIQQEVAWLEAQRNPDGSLKPAARGFERDYASLPLAKPLGPLAPPAAPPGQLPARVSRTLTTALPIAAAEAADRPRLVAPVLPGPQRQLQQEQGVQQQQLGQERTGRPAVTAAGAAAAGDPWGRGPLPWYPPGHQSHLLGAAAGLAAFSRMAHPPVLPLMPPSNQQHQQLLSMMWHQQQQALQQQQRPGGTRAATIPVASLQSDQGALYGTAGAGSNRGSLKK